MYQKSNFESGYANLGKTFPCLIEFNKENVAVE